MNALDFDCKCIADLLTMLKPLSYACVNGSARQHVPSKGDMTTREKQKSQKKVAKKNRDFQKSRKKVATFEGREKKSRKEKVAKKSRETVKMRVQL